MCLVFATSVNWSGLKLKLNYRKKKKFTKLTKKKLFFLMVLKVDSADIQISDTSVCEPVLDS